MARYQPLQIELEEIAGIVPALRAMRLAKPQAKSCYSHPENLKLAMKLIRGGPDHAKYQRGPEVFLLLTMCSGFMVEFDTYRHGVSYLSPLDSEVETLSTSSTMHDELKGLSGSDLAMAKQEGIGDKIYVRSIKISYQALRWIYLARKSHRHPDWQIFCDFIESLPYFGELICPEVRAEETDSASAAIQVLTREMQADREGYAWGWHCQLAMAAQDEGVDHETAQ